VVEVVEAVVQLILELPAQEHNLVSHLRLVAELEDGDILEGIIPILLRIQEQAVAAQVVQDLTGELAELHPADKDA